MPPRSRPTAPPAPATAPQTPSALLRSAFSLSVVSGKLISSKERAAGDVIAAAKPWTARAPISQPGDGDSDPIKEATEKRISPPMNILRRPK
jgi:hypothetical protein